MATLGLAIRQKRWEVVALYLLVGVLRAADGVPRDALEGMLEALEGETDAQT